MAAMNPFEIFGLKPQFRIDKQKLDEKYFEIQKKVHPDRFASASSAIRSSEVKPFARCEDTSLTKTAAVRFLKSFFLSSWNAERRSQMQRIPGIRLSWKC